MKTGSVTVTHYLSGRRKI